MKSQGDRHESHPPSSPLAEGRELKFFVMAALAQALPSPLAEGRELKFRDDAHAGVHGASPLAEGRELKYILVRVCALGVRRPSRRGVN